MLESWRDYLPPDDEQARIAANDAIRAARKQPVPAAVVDPAAAIAELGKAAAQAFRVAILCGPSSGQAICREYESLSRKVADAPAIEVIAFGVLARAECDAARVERAEGDPIAIGYAAVAAGRPHVARAKTNDARVRVLADAFERKDPTPFLDAIERFPSADGIGYLELVFIVHAFAIVADLPRPMNGGHRVGDIAWKLVHEGRAANFQPPAPVRAEHTRPPPTAEAIARAKPLVEGPRYEGPPLPWMNVGLEDVHGLWGGLRIAITSSGEVWATEVNVGKVTHRVHAQLSGATLRELAALLAKHDPAQMQCSTRYGIAGEGSPQLTFVRDGHAHLVWRWAGDRDPAFDAVATWLREASRVLTAALAAAPVR